MSLLKRRFADGTHEAGLVCEVEIRLDFYRMKSRDSFFLRVRVASFEVRPVALHNYTLSRWSLDLHPVLFSRSVIFEFMSIPS